jgi:hypothetical protein
MWSIVRLQDDSKSSQFSLLFNLIKIENDKENQRKKFSVNFLLPMVSLESEVEKTKFNILGGLLGFETGDNSKIRILYIPINI